MLACLVATLREAPIFVHLLAPTALPPNYFIEKDVGGRKNMACHFSNWAALTHSSLQ